VACAAALLAASSAFTATGSAGAAALAFNLCNVANLLGTFLLRRRQARELPGRHRGEFVVEARDGEIAIFRAKGRFFRDPARGEQLARVAARDVGNVRVQRSLWRCVVTLALDDSTVLRFELSRKDWAQLERELSPGTSVR
jgi:hypothetical protein